MHLMTWNLGRLGSRFNLLFEPYERRVMHSALGRFLDQPVDLMVGLVEPDGTQRTLPLSQHGTVFHNCEQFPRLNSLTFRGFSEAYRLRFEFNIHSVFYPQGEKMCSIPAFYLEMRLNPVERVRWIPERSPRPERVKLFIRLQRPDTHIRTSHVDGQARMDLSYTADTGPQLNLPGMTRTAQAQSWQVQVHERIVSLNPEAQLEEHGLTLDMPVTEANTGIKWRLVWGAHTNNPVMKIQQGDQTVDAPFRYTTHWQSIDAVMDEAITRRDDRLLRSRRFETLIDTAPITASQRHLISQSFQSFLSNAWWLSLPDGSDFFSCWEGSCFYHSTLDVEYNQSMFYLALWPDLLAKQLRQWTRGEQAHASSQGSYLAHDLGQGAEITGQRYPHDMPVEENCNYLLLMQAYAHWTGSLEVAKAQADLIKRLADYLVWTDRDGSGFASAGTANSIDDASPATQYAKKQTYLAVKRLAALQAAADLLRRVGDDDTANHYESRVQDDVPSVEAAAWLGDHYAVCVDKSAAGLADAWSGKPVPYDEIPGWDAYSIYTCNGLLLPTMTGQPQLFDLERMVADLTSATRETLSRYGCGHSSYEVENVWVSQNLWRDHIGTYLGLGWMPLLAQRYWDMQAMSNTHQQSYGYIDTYITNCLCFYPRGITSIGYLLAQPRLVIDRLAPGGARITVEPDRAFPQRWPLLPLADWAAGKIPICVVDAHGQVTIEGETDPVIVRGPKSAESSVIG